MSRRLHAEIAGAGFAGPTVAAALVQRGWSVCVHEQNSVLGEFGAGIFMWDKGLRVLAALGAYDTVLAGLHRARIFEMRTERNALILSEHFSAADGMRMLTMTRQHLYAPLLGAARRAGAEIRPDSAVAGAIPKGELILADGTRLAADLVVGCDGVNSRVRESLGLLCDDVKTALEAWECRERPLTKHTQDLARRHGERSPGFEGRKRWTEDAVRTAPHVPAGTA